jgi:CubicO group peptidase (beta-lactamase class C family)
MKQRQPLLLLVLMSALTSLAGIRETVGATPSFAQPGASALTAFLQGSVVVAIVGRDGVLYHEAFGALNVSKKIPMPKDAIFNIASMTKPVTSVALMMLVDERRLTLDDDVSMYLPRYGKPLVLSKVDSTGDSFETRPARGPITIRHLLTHTSGIGYGFSSPTVSALQQMTMLSELDLPLLFEPGEGWAYGASTRVLGNVVEALSGQRIDRFLESRILRPLGMRDTSYEVPAEKQARVASSHARTNGELVERQPFSAPVTSFNGDGGLFSTAADYGLFVRMLLGEGRLGSARLLKEDTVRTMFKSHTGSVVVQTQQTTNPTLSRPFPLGAGEDTWGLGFQLSNPRARKPNTRSPGSGTWAGIFNTHFWIDRKKEIGVVVMMQTLPFYDEQAMRVLAGVEERVYQNLK